MLFRKRFFEMVTWPHVPLDRSAYRRSERTLASIRAELFSNVLSVMLKTELDAGMSASMTPLKVTHPVTVFPLN
jgi:hypothetical protein